MAKIGIEALRKLQNTSYIIDSVSTILSIASGNYLEGYVYFVKINSIVLYRYQSRLDKSSGRRQILLHNRNERCWTFWIDSTSSPHNSYFKRNLGWYYCFIIFLKKVVFSNEYLNKLSIRNFCCRLRVGQSTALSPSFLFALFKL